MRKLVLAFCLALATTPAAAQTLDNPYGGCDRQTFDTAVALARSGDRRGLESHLRSYGCRGIDFRAFRLFALERELEDDHPVHAVPAPQRAAPRR